MRFQNFWQVAKMLLHIPDARTVVGVVFFKVLHGDGGIFQAFAERRKGKDITVQV